MLINSVRKVYREVTGKMERARPVVTVAANRPAANTSRFGNGEKLNRRLRRQRRLQRTEHRAIHGWSVSTW